MFGKKQKIILLLIMVLAVSGIIFFPHITRKIKWNEAEAAASKMPYQIGITKAVITPCIVTPPPSPICTVGGPSPDPSAVAACGTKTPVLAQCPLYAYASGIQAGGMGSGGLFLLSSISAAGLTAGGQFIAGGMSPVLMDNGVLASAGGCFGCVAKSEGLFGRIAEAADFIIAGFKNIGK